MVLTAGIAAAARIVPPYSLGGASVHPQLMRGSLDPLESAFQMAARSV